MKSIKTFLKRIWKKIFHKQIKYSELWLTNSHRVTPDNLEKFMDEEDFKIAYPEGVK